MITPDKRIRLAQDPDNLNQGKQILARHYLYLNMGSGHLWSAQSRRCPDLSDSEEILIGRQQSVDNRHLYHSFPLSLGYQLL
jgi:hypothetical protein